MIKGRVLTVFFLLVSPVFLTGCGKTYYGMARFESVPPGAEIINLRDDSQLGTTPVDIFWESKDGKTEYVTVKFRKMGYEEKITSFWVNKNQDTREEASQEAQRISVELEKKESEK